MEFEGIYTFILAFVCNCNLFHKFWTERDEDFIFGMHIQLPEPFQMTPKLMTLTDLYTIKGILYFIAAGGIGVSQAHLVDHNLH